MTPLLASLPFAVLAPALAAAQTAAMWYAIPLVVSVSFVCAATRHELMRPIIEHAVRFGVWLLVFMAVFVGLLSVLEWMA
jgi:hypothetical protein